MALPSFFQPGKEGQGSMTRLPTGRLHECVLGVFFSFFSFFPILTKDNLASWRQLEALVLNLRGDCGSLIYQNITLLHDFPMFPSRPGCGSVGVRINFGGGALGCNGLMTAGRLFGGLILWAKGIEAS